MELSDCFNLIRDGCKMYTIYICVFDLLYVGQYVCISLLSGCGKCVSVSSCSCVTTVPASEVVEPVVAAGGGYSSDEAGNGTSDVVLTGRVVS